MNCLVCKTRLEVKVCQGKKGKKAVMLSCPNDGRHFRAFINDPKTVDSMTQIDLSSAHEFNPSEHNSRKGGASIRHNN